MRPTQKQWCDTCKQMTYGCKHPENAVPIGDPELTPEQRAKIFREELEKRHGAPRSRLSFVCFELACFAGCVIADVAVHGTVQVAFKPERLVVDPLIAPFFKLRGIRVGHCHQEAHPWSHGVGCKIFEPNRHDLAPLNNLEGIDVVQAGMEFTLQVENITPFVHDFNALVWGQAIF